MRRTLCVAVIAAAAVTLHPALALAADTGSANCTLITQAAADGITARIHVLPHPGMFPSRDPIASPECSRSTTAASSANTL